jgi:hypothetical protein
MNNYYIFKLAFIYIQIVQTILFAQESVNRFDGVWKSFEYGETLEINGDSASIYQQNNSKLLKRQFTKGIVCDNTLTMITRDSPFEGVTNYQLSVADSVLILLEEHADNVYYYHKVVKKEPMVNYSKDPIINLSYFWNMHFERYPYFMERNIDWIKARDKIDSLSNKEMDETELFNYLKMLVDFFVNDGHIWVASRNKKGFDFYTPLHKNPIESIKPKKDLMYLIGEKYLDQHQYMTTANGKIIYKYLQNDVGYIFFSSFYEMSDKKDKTEQIENLKRNLDEMYTYFKDAQGLIVDVRYNGGGNDWAALTCSGLFLSKSHAVLSKRSLIQGTNKYGLPQISRTSVLLNNLSNIPTVVLSGKFSVSATETFLIALKQRKDILSMGEASRGMLSDSYVFELPNGWFFGVYSDKVYSYDGKIYENQGVPVDQEIQMNKADYDKGIDTVLEAAISHFKK